MYVYMYAYAYACTLYTIFGFGGTNACLIFDKYEA